MTQTAGMPQPTRKAAQLLAYISPCQAYFEVCNGLDKVSPYLNSPNYESSQ